MTVGFLLSVHLQLSARKIITRTVLWRKTLSLNPRLTVRCSSASALQILWELEIEMENKMDDLVFWLLTLSLILSVLKGRYHMNVAKLSL